MAKTTKKKSKKRAAKKTKSKEVELSPEVKAAAEELQKDLDALEEQVEELEALEQRLSPMPAIEPGLVTIALEPADLQSLANLLSVSARTFEGLAMAAAKENDEGNFAILQARQRLSSMFANRFVEFCKMPEPESRDIH